MKKFWVCLIVLTVVSCTETMEHRIPYRQVYLELDLNFEDKILLNPNQSKIYTSNNITAIEKAGYGGVIVYHSPIGGYLAYDLSCPYEAEVATKLTIEDETAGVYAICPKCQSRYELINGFPTKESISTYNLEPYRVVQESSTKLIVINRNN